MSGFNGLPWNPLVLSTWSTKVSEQKLSWEPPIRIRFDQIWRYCGVCVLRMVGVSISTESHEIAVPWGSVREMGGRGGLLIHPKRQS